MIKQLPHLRQKLFFACTLITLLLAFSYSALSQTTPGMFISWDKEVGCQTYGVDDQKRIFFTDISPSECIRVCENSTVTYSLSNLPAGASTTWNAVGGVLSYVTESSCTVTWGAFGDGSLSFTVTNGNSIINKTLCIKKILIPTALFEIAPGGQSQPVYTCSDQIINFVNLSTANNGTNLVSYYWDFGDDTSSTAFQPSHSYAANGTYEVILIVGNECNCTSVYKTEIVVKDKGFDISCPSVICEDQTQTYSLPFDGMQICNENFNWSVVGGHILSQQGGNVEVIWDDVDQDGFGYVTFNPQDCNLPCLLPTTIKIPVIQTNGTIEGPTNICLGEQGRYSLPQWPTTDFQWQIVGNVANNLGEIFQTDQRNEIIVVPNVTGTLTLRVTYTNTLLHCSGEAEIVIQVGKALEIIGEEALCQYATATYFNTDGVIANWTLTSDTGGVLYNVYSSDFFEYPFTEPGNYILTANADNYCPGEQKTITVFATPETPEGVDGDLLVCPNAPYTYSIQNPDSAGDYEWAVTNGTIIGATTGEQVNITFTGTFPAIISVYKKSLSPVECNSTPFTVAINQIPVTAVISSDFGAVCSSSVASYQALVPTTTTAHTSGDTYTWSISNPSLGSISSGQGTNAVDVTWNNVTNVTNVDLILTIGKCNISPAPQFIKPIILYPKTEIDITTPTNPICAGALYSVTFTVVSNNGVPLVPTDVVTWNLGSGEFTTPAGQFYYTTTLTNTSTVSIDQVVTAFIADANGCGKTNTKSITVTVLPNPPGIATLTSSANAFCIEDDIDATIAVSSNTTGVSFVWLKDGNPLVPAQTGISLNVTPDMGFGTYTFQVTNTNNCITISNPIYISQICSGPSCTIPESVSNDSYLSSCGTITFSGTYTGTPLNEVWEVLGPAPSDYTLTSTGLTGKPGNYKIIYKVYYPCQEGGTGFITKIQDVVIPYLPEFSYTVKCSDEDNTFDINFLDNSTFFAPVLSQDVRFYYKLASASSFTGPVTYDPSLTINEISNLPAGNYVFRQEVDGLYPNTTTFTCSKEYTVNLQGVDPFLDIEVNDNLDINCHDTAVLFELSIPQGTGTSILWDFGDGSQNTLSSPSRVFTTPNAPYNVTCTVTNQFGCSRIIPVSVYIPKKCFFGDVVATPSSATVCQGQVVTLKYQPNNDFCDVANYTWMDGNQPVVGAANSDELTVTSTGFYWVKVESVDGCSYDTPTQIKPLFNTLPTVKLLGATSFCQGEDVSIRVNTNASLIQWYVNNSLYSQFNNLTEAVFTNLLPVGDYTVEVVVTSPQGCTNSASQVISIVEGIYDIAFDVSITCDPYQVVIKAVPSPNSEDITYNWSNGEHIEMITVPDGGTYSVTATLGGCSFTAEVDVPKNPENYLWIFPSGCYNDCTTETNYLIGPTLPLAHWSWNLNSNAEDAGNDSFATPYTLIKDGLYTLTVSTGDCKAESAPLDYSTTKCDKCKIDFVDVKNVVKNETPYCSFTFEVQVVSNSTVAYQATVMDDLNNVLVLPSTITIQPGFNVFFFTVIPQNPFVGGTTHWTIQGAVPNGKEGFIDCIYDVSVIVPTCDSISSKIVTTDATLEHKTLVQQELTLYPNPANDLVTLSYRLSSPAATVEIYDIAGRSISTNVLSSSVGDLQLNTSSYPSGIYIVVVKQDGVLLTQKKLVIE
ncbi:hypothetical protein FAQ01_27770 [Flavobacterium aquatile]|nr:hypothetical protein FAQ01_27770 [Flavobacterium aquatile]